MDLQDKKRYPRDIGHDDCRVRDREDDARWNLEGGLVLEIPSC